MMDTKKKSKPLSAGSSIARKPRKHNPAFEKFIEAMKKNGGWVKYGEMPSFRDGTTHLPFNLLVHIKDLKQLAYPDNPTPYMVEVVHVGRSFFLHLVKKPPEEVLDVMSTASYSASNDIRGIMEALSKALPSKPATKKAKPVPAQAPAKKAKPTDDKVSSTSIPAESSYKGTPVDNLPRHPKNPFRPGSGYGLLVDILASERLGIYKQALVSMYRIITNKTEARVGYDLAVIATAQRGITRHKSCQEGFFVIKQGDVYSIEFE